MKKYLFYPLFIAIMSWIAVKAFHRDHKLKTSTPKDPVPQETDVVTETPAQPHPETSSAPIPEASSTPNPEVSDTPITPDAPIPQETDTSPLSPQTTQNISPIQLRLQQSYRPDEEKAVKKILQEELKVDDVRALINSSQSVRGPESPGLQALQGSFTGQLAPSAYHNEVWDIETELHWTEEGNGVFRSDYHIITSSPSRGPFSRTSGTGAPNSFRALTEDGLLFEVSPDMFIHAFYLPQADVFSGNFYSIDDSGKTRYHGPIILKRP